MPMNTLADLFHETLRDVYYAEKKLLKALPKMAKNASDESLAAALTDHLTETEGQVERLEQVFEMIGKPARGKK
jgi:ferritin-like metal-binding protein YciE